MDAKANAQHEVTAVAAALVELSHAVHSHPELAFEEERAAAWVADALSGPFSIAAGVCELPTAFVATAGTGPLTVAICAEYDALPSIGHACGHNVIAAAAVGAGLALAPLADELGITVKVIGTPAEEKGGGKVLLLERGAFAGVHAAMMVHPMARDDMEQMPCLAVQDYEVHFHGKTAHASAFPELGINAADAITVSQTAIGLLRQHIRQTRPHPRHRPPRWRRAQHRPSRDSRSLVRPVPEPPRARRARTEGSEVLRRRRTCYRVHR